MKTFIISVENRYRSSYYDIPQLINNGHIKHVFLKEKSAKKIKINHTTAVVLDRTTVSRAHALITDLCPLELFLVNDRLQVYQNNDFWPEKRVQALINNSGFDAQWPFLEYLSVSMDIKVGTRTQKVYMATFDGFSYSPMTILCQKCGTKKHVDGGAAFQIDDKVLNFKKEYVYCACNNNTFFEFASTFIYKHGIMGSKDVRASNFLFEDISLGRNFEAFFHVNIRTTEIGPFTIAKNQDPDRPAGYTTIRKKMWVTEENMKETTFDHMHLITSNVPIRIYKEHFKKLYRKIRGKTEIGLDDLFTQKFIKGNIKFG